MNFLKFGSIFLLVTSLGSCSSDNPNPGGGDLFAVSTLDFKILVEESYISTGLNQSRRVDLFSNQESLNQSLSLFGVQPSDNSTIDFDTAQVVLVSMGPRNTGGYSVDVVAVEEFDDYIKLLVEHTLPGENCLVTEALTNPFIFVEISSTVELIVEEMLLIDECS